MAYYKAWFTDGTKTTAKLVFNDKMDPFPQSSAEVAEFSKFYPYSEASKMKRLLRGPMHDTWDAAFNDDSVWDHGIEPIVPCGACGWKTTKAVCPSCGNDRDC